MRKIFKILVVFFILIIICTYNVFAMGNLNISITTSNQNAKVDDVIDVTVDWTQEMQAADYELNYDSSKLQFISINIQETYYNNIEPGKVIVCWYGDASITNMVFKFKVLDKGDANISVKADAFATESLESPSDIVTTPITIQLEDKVTATPIPTSTPIPTATPAPTNIPENNDDKNDEVVQIKKEEDKSMSNNKIPHAGKGQKLIIAIIAILILAVVLKIKLRNLRDVE